MPGPPSGKVKAVLGALESCRSVRGFLDRPVPLPFVERILLAASRAPSGNNSQPWRVHVLTGAGWQALTDAIMAVRRTGAKEPVPEYDYYPGEWPEPYLSRRQENGWALYGLLGVAKGDRDKGSAWNDKNYRFYGAPIGLILTWDWRLGLGSFMDLGMFMQGVAVAARGLDTCPQAAFAHYHAVIREELHLALEDMVVCGMSLRFADANATANRLQTEREPVTGFAPCTPVPRLPATMELLCMANTVADQMVKVFAAAGVERVYGIVGDSLNGFTDTLRRHGGIWWLHTRHKEVAAFAAAGDAHVTGKLQVCAGSCGPGNLHLINGLFDCHRSRLPVVAIAAHIPSAEIGSGFFQEIHPEQLFLECSSYCETVSNPEQMLRLLELCIRRAERCVCVLVIPGDIALLPTDAPAPAASGLPPPPTITPHAAAVTQLAELLNTSKRVTLLCGAGCEGAHDELLQLAGALHSPIVHAMRGKEHVERDNPYNVGMTGLIGFSSGYCAMEDCDALLMLGTDFPYRQFYPKGARSAQVDIRAEAIGRRTPIEMGPLGDVRSTLQALTPQIKAGRDEEHLRSAVKHYKDARKGLDEFATGKPGRTMPPQHVARVVDQLAADDAVFTCEVGLPTVWAARYLPMNGRRRLVGSFWHGSMACAMPQALAALAACPGWQVISLSGDGGFTMLMGDLLSAKQLGLSNKVVVFNNGALGFIKLEQKPSGFVDTGTELDNPDFAAMARAIGIHGVRIEDPAELEAKMADALVHPGPVLIDAVVNRMNLAMPPKVTAGMAKNFTLYMLRAVMNGRGDKVVELARSNLVR